MGALVDGLLSRVWVGMVFGEGEIEVLRYWMEEGYVDRTMERNGRGRLEIVEETKGV